MKIRVATWNLDHARSRSHDDFRATLLRELQADVVVLTETDDRVHPGEGWTAIHSAPRPNAGPTERWVTAWSRLPVIELVPTVDVFRSVAALVEGPAGQLLIYGTVLPWHADRGDMPTEPPPWNWAEHRRVVTEQTHEWLTLAKAYPDASLVIAGDWNTDLLAGSGHADRAYGTSEETRLLLDTVDALGLKVPTRTIADPGTRPWLIDHIAVPPIATVAAVVNAVTSAGTVVSDHPAVCVSICTVTD